MESLHLHYRSVVYETHDCHQHTLIKNARTKQIGYGGIQTHTIMIMIQAP